MRNLKKILALVLALVMSLSLMATAGAKDFGDSDQVNANYKTAIDVLSELKVFGGYDDGTFKPQQNITRAEVAAIIYRIATGDVMGDKVALYSDMANSKLADLNQAEWARGQINYCYNAGIIKGVNNTDFEPNANITGYAALSMILRALGYGQNGEFVGTQWEMNTASRARALGLLDKITEGQLGLPATREMVAEILFRAMLKETVTWTALNGYQTTGTTLAKSILGLDDVVGVVVANEWANLEGSKPLAEGKTTLKIDGKNRTVNVSTEGADLGTSVHVYLKGEDVLTAVEDAGNDIRTNEGAKTTVKDLRGDMDVNDETEYFINYAEVTKEYSDWRLEYVVVLKDWTEKEIAQLVYDNGGVAFKDADKDLTVDAAEKASCIYPEDTNNANSAKWLKDNGSTTKDTYTYDKSIKAGTKLSSDDLYYMETIFRGSDSFNDDAYQGHDIMNGEVYAATKSGKYDADKSYDVSDDLSWNEFCEKYLDMNANDSIDGAANGESLRAIDNDGDGVAEYVLKVEFVMTTVVDYDKRTDSYFVEYDKDELSAKDTGIKASAIKAMDGKDDPDLSTEAVVLYALVDGVYYTTNPEVATMTIDKKGIDTKNDTYTVDGEDHIWSGIFKEAAHYYKELKELAEGVSYDFHQDYFGYTRLANEHVKPFVLLTDGYYWSNRRDEEKKAQIYDDSQEQLVDVDVNDYDSKEYPNGYFIYENANWDSIDDAWKRLITFGTTYGLYNTVDGTTYYHYDRSDWTEDNEVAVKDPFKTNIAAYTEDDGKYNLYSVRDIDTNFLHRNRPYRTYEIAGTKQGTAYADSEVTVKKGSVSAKDTTLYGITSWADETNIADEGVRRVQTTSKTQYYYVTWDAKGEAEVTSWIGYSNVPEDLGDFVAQRAYTVAYTSDSNANYDVAEVVVFEGKYNDPVYTAWLTYAGRGDNRYNEYEYSLGIDPDGEEGYGDWLTRLGVFYWDNIKSIDLIGDNSDKLLKFWTLDSNGDAVEAPIAGKHYEDYGIYYGVINTRQNVNWRDYITFGEGKAVYEVLKSDDMVEYRFVFDTNKLDSEIYAIDADPDTRLMDTNEVIYMTNAKDEIALVVNLSDSVDQKGNHIDLDQIPQLAALRDSVRNDQNEVKNSDITFANVTVKGEKVKDGKVTISNKAANDGTTAGLKFSTNADEVTVVTATGTLDKTKGVWTANAGTVAAGTYKIILEKAGCDPVTKTVTVTVADASTDATIKSLKIKGVSVDLSKTDGTDTAITLTAPVTVNAAANASNEAQLEVVLNDANADYTVTPDSSGIVSKGAGTGALTAGTYTDKVKITVTPESGAGGNVVYTIKTLTVQEYSLSVGTVSVTDPAGDASTKAEVSLTNGTKIPNDAPLTFTVTPDEGYEIVNVSYTTASTANNSGTFGPSADNKYTIPAAKLTGEATVNVTVVVKKSVTDADLLKAAKDGGRTSINGALTLAKAETSNEATKTTLDNYANEALQKIAAAQTPAEVDSVVAEYTQKMTELVGLEVKNPDDDDAENAPVDSGHSPVDGTIVSKIVAGRFNSVIKGDTAYVSGTLDPKNVFTKGQVLTDEQATALCEWGLAVSNPTPEQKATILDTILSWNPYAAAHSTYFAIVEVVGPNGVALVGVSDDMEKDGYDFSGVVFPNT